MSELSPESRALLASLASSHDPPPEAAARVRASVEARVTSPPMPQRWPWIVGVAVAVLIAVTVLARRPSPQITPTNPPPARVAIVTPTELVRDASAAQRAPTAAPVAAATTPPATPAAVRPRRVEADDDLAGELLLIQSAQRALARGDGPAALEALDEHARAHPRGRLLEERQAARVLALCAAGRADEARAAATRFVARYPTSPQAARVRGACAR